MPTLKDRNFRYFPSYASNIAKTFERIREQQQLLTAAEVRQEREEQKYDSRNVLDCLNCEAVLAQDGVMQYTDRLHRIPGEGVKQCPDCLHWIPEVDLFSHIEICPDRQ